MGSGDADSARAMVVTFTVYPGGRLPRLLRISYVLVVAGCGRGQLGVGHEELRWGRPPRREPGGTRVSGVTHKGGRQHMHIIVYTQPG